MPGTIAKGLNETRVITLVALYPGHMGGEKRHGIDCLCSENNWLVYWQNHHQGESGCTFCMNTQGSLHMHTRYMGRVPLTLTPIIMILQKVRNMILKAWIHPFCFSASTTDSIRKWRKILWRLGINLHQCFNRTNKIAEGTVSIAWSRTWPFQNSFLPFRVGRKAATYLISYSNTTMWSGKSARVWAQYEVVAKSVPFVRAKTWPHPQAHSKNWRKGLVSNLILALRLIYGKIHVFDITAHRGTCNTVLSGIPGMSEN